MMRLRRGCAVLAVVLASAMTGARVRAQEGGSSRAPALSVEVLSDVHGADLGSYLNDFTDALEKNWKQRMASAPDSPASYGEAAISFVIGPTGMVEAMHLDSASRNDALSKAAWSALEDMKPMPLPPALGNTKVKLRIHFVMS